MLSSFDLKAHLAERSSWVEGLLAVRLDALRDAVPERLLEAMRYSLMAGGKRLRPVLLVSFADAVSRSSCCGGVLDDAACALEYVHTYSLIHDDLPAMDDGELRRGRPTNHKVFGEAVAILAGDALLTEAFSLLCARNDDLALRGVLAGELASAAGATGMVGGQVLDVAEERPAEVAHLIRVHRLKTGALIRAACRMGVRLANGTSQQLQLAQRYGDAAGLAFQIADDLLDVTATPSALGKAAQPDAVAGKATFPAVLGLDASRAMAVKQVELAVAAAAELEPRGGPLAAIARYCIERGS